MGIVVKKGEVKIFLTNMGEPRVICLPESVTAIKNKYFRADRSIGDKILEISETGTEYKISLTLFGGDNANHYLDQRYGSSENVGVDIHDTSYDEFMDMYLLEEVRQIREMLSGGGN